MAAVRRGLPALVTPAGSTSPVDGVITDIGLLPAASASATGTAYPVTVLVSQPVAALATGSRAAVSIVVTTVDNVLTVPTSAVTVVTTGRAFVTTLSRGVTSRTPVTVGAVGSSLTEITQGLALGQTVVLADLSQPLPTNTTNLRRFNGGGFSRPGGASVGGGGGRGGLATSNP